VKVDALLDVLRIGVAVDDGQGFWRIARDAAVALAKPVAVRVEAVLRSASFGRSQLLQDVARGWNGRNERGALPAGHERSPRMCGRIQL
jgi:hypothetical protein